MQDDFGFSIDYDNDIFGDLAWKLSFFLGYGYYGDWYSVDPSDNPV